MFGIGNRPTRVCEGWTRREFLRVGGLALGGLTLSDLQKAQAQPPRLPSPLGGERSSRPGRPRARHCILLYMWGGPAHQETFDLKPHAPEGIRSQFHPIATRVPGIQICEHLPRLAQYTDRFAIVRSVTHNGVNHATSAYHMLTGHVHFRPGPGSVPTPDDFPQIGAAVGRFGRQPEDMPASVSLPSILVEGDGRIVAGQGPGVLGPRHTPFMVLGDPTREDFSVDTLRLPDDLNADRLRHRADLRSALLQRSRLASPETIALDESYERVYRLLESPRAQRALNLTNEPARSRDRYGRHHFGQSCLLARRLVEADVSLVTVYWNTGAAGAAGNWDTHDDESNRLKSVLLPPFERAYTALLDDLDSRGQLDETLVVWMGEFGRTPRINRNAGRDHWGFCQSVLLAGGGIRGGQVYGSSDAHAAYAAERPVSPDDLAATVFSALGIPLDLEMHDNLGRPMPLCTGRAVDALFG
ncbi:MAG: DUF1501 domain-containing protein [Gemmataceae bacterium]|nr:DUF1501 domain-containing protein [Gemmataceae bacterium]